MRIDLSRLIECKHVSTPMHIYPNHVTHNAGNIVGVVNIITFKQTFTIRLAFGSLDILIITVKVVLPAIDYLIQNCNSSTIILLEYVCLAQQGLCKLFGDTIGKVVQACLFLQIATVDSFGQILVHQCPKRLCITICLGIFVCFQRMVHQRRSSPKTDQFDVGHRTENLCLCTCTKLNLRIIAYILQNNVGGINHFIKIRIQRFNMGKIRVERISRQQLCTGSRPAFPCRIAIVRKKILQPERRRIGVLPIAIAGYNGFFRIGIRFIEIFESAYPMLRNIQIVLTRGKESAAGK